MDLLALGNSVWNYVTPAWENVHGRMAGARGDKRGIKKHDKQEKTMIVSKI